MSETRTATPGVSGGFLNRAFAVIFDLLIVGVIVAATTAAVYPATNGLVRMSDPSLSLRMCGPSKVPAGFDPADGIADLDPDLKAKFTGNLAAIRYEVTECVVYLFGFEIDRQRTIQAWNESDIHSSLTYEVPVDRSGAVASNVVYLDNAVGPAMLVLAVLGETVFGFSLGKLLTGLRVRTRSDDRKRAGFGSVLGRNLLIYGPSAAFGLFSLFSDWIPEGPVGMIGGVGLTAVVLAWGIALVIGLARGRPDPFWDTWSGTRVVRR